MKLPKTYEAQQYEQRIYQLWEESGAMQPAETGKGNFSIVLPPPNATGKLHVGHAAMLAIEDILVRYHRMQGQSVLWIPGIDHAAIATNAVMERQLAEEGIDKHKLGREEFLRRTGQFVEDSRQTIRAQIRAMGASLDWTKERYTMEPAMNRIVSEVFIKMYHDGLIYRDKRIVNWDHVLQTTVSDDEVEYREEAAPLYTLQYGPFQIATARPETKFGDKYVVMHPDDPRYKDYRHGQTIDLEWINGPVTATVIKDTVIDPQFGTGAMTITPWHDVTDFEIAQRHKLDMEQIIDLDGRLLPVAGPFTRQHIDEARAKIVAKLKKKGLLVKVDENYLHRVAVSDRGKAVIEPQIMEQWWVDVDKKAVSWKMRKRSLKEVMRSVVEDGQIEILPARFKKIYYHWIDNLRPWCISRQIWWGHQIPAWYLKEKDGQPKTHIGHVPPDDRPWQQDPDTLDTWFSSALWTWSTMIPPEVALHDGYSIKDMLAHSPLYQRYHPTTVMETGYDIIFFWVARMILMTTYVTGDIPFQHVYLHGLVRTKEGLKMSKSDPRTTIDPLDMIGHYGTDALRLSLVVGQAPGNDMRIYPEKIASFRNFSNKLWNVARFVEAKVGEDYQDRQPQPKYQADHWILSRLQDTEAQTTKLLGKFELGKAFDVLYHFIWDDLADWYIEISKVQFSPTVLTYVLENTLKLTHPFAPFVTETIWDTLDWEQGLLMASPWPKSVDCDRQPAEEFKEVMAVVREIRQLCTAMGTNGNILYYTEGDFLAKNAELIAKLGGLVAVKRVSSGHGLHLTHTEHDAWLDIEEQKAHDYLLKMIAKQKSYQQRIKMLGDRLANRSYTEKAPKQVVQETREQLQRTEELTQRLTNEIDVFQHALKQL